MTRRVARLADRDPRRSRCRAVAAPLVDRFAAKGPTGRKVDRGEDVPAGPVAVQLRQAGPTRSVIGDLRLQEFEVEVTVAVVDDPLGAEEDLVRSAGRVLDGVGVLDLVLVRNGSRVVRERVDIAVVRLGALSGEDGRVTRLRAPVPCTESTRDIDRECVHAEGLSDDACVARRLEHRRLGRDGLPVEDPAVVQAAGSAGDAPHAPGCRSGGKRAKFIGPVVAREGCAVEGRVAVELEPGARRSRDDARNEDRQGRGRRDGESKHHPRRTPEEPYPFAHPAQPRRVLGPTHSMPTLPCSLRRPWGASFTGDASARR